MDWPQPLPIKFAPKDRAILIWNGKKWCPGIWDNIDYGWRYKARWLTRTRMIEGVPSFFLEMPSMNVDGQPIETAPRQQAILVKGKTAWHRAWFDCGTRWRWLDFHVEPTAVVDNPTAWMQPPPDVKRQEG